MALAEVAEAETENSPVFIGCFCFPVACNGRRNASVSVVKKKSDECRVSHKSQMVLLPVWYSVNGVKLQKQTRPILVL